MGVGTGVRLNPLVTVVLPTYHSVGTLAEALDSIARQTYRNIDIIIVADEPTPRELSIIREHSDRHLRTTLIQHQERQGLPASLNEGFALAQGTYIARMDADDISYPDRIRQQVEYMEAHPDVGVCGTNIIHEWNGVSERGMVSTDNAGIIATMIMLGCPIIHPTAMIRTSFIRTIPGPYTERFQFAEDYDLWIRCIGKTQFHNLDQVLLCYRSDGTNVCAANKAEQAIQLAELRALAATTAGFPPQGDLCLDEYLHRLYEANRGSRIPADSFNRILGERWYNSCLMKANRGIVAWYIFWDSPLSRYMPLTIIRKIKFIGACLIRKQFDTSPAIRSEYCPKCGKPLIGGGV